MICLINHVVVKMPEMTGNVAAVIAAVIAAASDVVTPADVVAIAVKLSHHIMSHV